MNNNKPRKFLSFIVIFFLTINCGYNKIQELDENVKADMAEILNQYKRRADLIPSIVKVVEQYANFEKEVLIEVTKARAEAGKMQITPDMANDGEALMKFQKAQGVLSLSLQKFLAVSEKYPDLKANEMFHNLIVELEGSQNRITVATGRYIKSVQAYNVYVRQFPGMLWAKMFDYKIKPTLTAENQEEINKIDSDVMKPPSVDMDKK